MRTLTASLTVALLCMIGDRPMLFADTPATQPAKPWLGVHLSVGNDKGAQALLDALPRLSAAGVNVIVMEIGYGFEYQSHPEMRADGGLSKAMARKLGDACRRHGVRPIPQINCLGHQSWDQHTGPLLTKHPEFDETPGQYPDNKGIYCRSWCPLHPNVNAFVFDLMDELIDVFQADAFHVGMDEVFLIASDHCPRCKGKSPAELFAKAVKDYHAHLVGQRKVEMLMWGDRLLDSKTVGYGKWEAAENGTQAAIDLIPKDIIICDWHYGKRKSYPSIPLFIEKGFRVWPSGWDKADATEALAQDALKHRGPKMLGHLCTTWGKAGPAQLADFAPLQAALKVWRSPQ